ncbi:MAG TPA: hypothetical protein VHZ76_02165, partial [Gammaproteobacteria bacterium]|nr:hypothetical protein [Gammaproteobacteria bacterium]
METRRSYTEAIAFILDNRSQIWRWPNSLPTGVKEMVTIHQGSSADVSERSKRTIARNRLNKISLLGHDPEAVRFYAGVAYDLDLLNWSMKKIELDSDAYEKECYEKCRAFSNSEIFQSDSRNTQIKEIVKTYQSSGLVSSEKWVQVQACAIMQIMKYKNTKPLDANLLKLYQMILGEQVTDKFADKLQPPVFTAKPVSLVTVVDDTPLHLAAKHNPENIPSLLKSGENPRSKNGLGQTPLYCLLSNHQISIERMAKLAVLLIKNGADANTQIEDGRTLLHILASGLAASVFLEYFSILVSFYEDADFRANPKIQDNKGQNVLAYLLKNGGITVSTGLALIEQGGVDPNSRVADGDTFMHRVIYSCAGDHEVTKNAVHRILAKGADLSIRNKSNFTVLEELMILDSKWPTDADKINLMLTLVKNNADAMVKNQYNENLLQIIYKRYPQLKEHIASTWPIAADQLENPEIFKQIDIKTLQSEVAKEAREEKRLKKSVKEENVGGGTIKALISQLRSSSEREIELTAWTTDRSKKVDAPPKQKE